jgi:hypothetical protein
LRRTSLYASLFGISGALHLDVFEQPATLIFFSMLFEKVSFGVCSMINLAGGAHSV